MSNAQAVVYKGGVAAATLAQSDGQTNLAYLPEYLNNYRQPIATTLPLTEQNISLSRGAVPAFFAGLLPEGLRLNALARRIKASVDNELALLLEVGADPVGDVQILLPDADPRTKAEALELTVDASDLDFGAIREEYAGTRSSGLAGFQDKVSSRMLNAPARARGRDYILKLNPLDTPFVVENEAYFLGLARACGLKTSTHQVLTDAKGAHGLLLERWDRPVVDGTKQRLAAEDACQVLDLYPADKYSPSFEAVSQALLGLCPAKGPAALNLFQQLVFAWLTGNGDVHAKNISILQTTAGEWRISPVYDLVCTLFYEDRTMALSVDGADSGWSRGTLLVAAAALELPSLVANQVIDRQLKALAGLPSAILDGALPFPRHLNTKVAGLLKRRAELVG